MSDGKRVAKKRMTKDEWNRMIKLTVTTAHLIVDDTAILAKARELIRELDDPDGTN